MFSYQDYADKMSASEYADKVINGKLHDPVLSFEFDNGFKFIKILPNYLDDIRSRNYASFIKVESSISILYLEIYFDH